MRTGLTKKQKTAVIYFDEHSRIIEVQTHNTDFKKRLAAFAAKHPQCCRQTDDDEQGGLTFDIEKGRLSFRLTAPYSEERRRAARESGFPAEILRYERLTLWTGTIRRTPRSGARCGLTLPMSFWNGTTARSASTTAAMSGRGSIKSPPFISAWQRHRWRKKESLPSAAN